MFQLCEARPDLSGALFLFCKKEKSGNGGRIKAPKLLQIKKPDSGESGFETYISVIIFFFQELRLPFRILWLR